MRGLKPGQHRPQDQPAGTTQGRHLDDRPSMHPAVLPRDVIAKTTRPKATSPRAKSECAPSIKTQVCVWSEANRARRRGTKRPRVQEPAEKTKQKAGDDCGRTWGLATPREQVRMRGGGGRPTTEGAGPAAIKMGRQMDASSEGAQENKAKQKQSKYKIHNCKQEPHS